MPPGTFGTSRGTGYYLHYRGDIVAFGDTKGPLVLSFSYIVAFGDTKGPLVLSFS